jgi:polyhydroxyalkanoate synthesis regulator phasin
VTDLERLTEIQSQLAVLNERLERGDLSAAEATEVLEQITKLAQDAVAAIERSTEALDE